MAWLRRRWRGLCANPARKLVGLTLFVVAFTTVVANQRHQGVVRDEDVYMHAANRYADWWSDFLTLKKHTLTKASITQHFGGKRLTANNREHPPLMKTLFGFSEKLTHNKLGWTSEITGYRLPTALFNALLILFVFLWVERLWGMSAGIMAALLTLLMPRALFHAGLAAFDAPVVAIWCTTVFAYYQALKSRRWCIVLGVCFGLALAIKHNALILPSVFLTHYVLIALHNHRDQLVRGQIWRTAGRALWRNQPWVFPALFVLGPLVAITLWPWLWFDTSLHVRQWIGFHLDHTHYNYEYLGQNWNHPPFPWHVPIVTTLLTVPVATLVAGVIGAAHLGYKAYRRESADEQRGPALLMFLSAGAAMGPFLLGTSPIFGAEKHFAAAMVTIAIYGGVGVVVAARLLVRALGMQRRAVEVAAIVGVSVSVCAAALVETADAQPYALSHYNALAGGAPGGADLGMNRQFWGYSARGVLPFLNEARRRNKQPILPVYFHDADMTIGWYQRAGLLDRRIRNSGREGRGIAQSQYAIVVHELHFNRHDYMIWKSYGTVQPVYVLTTDGVPIVSVYARPPLMKQYFNRATTKPRPRSGGPKAPSPHR